MRRKYHKIISEMKERGWTLVKSEGKRKIGPMTFEGKMWFENGKGGEIEIVGTDNDNGFATLSGPSGVRDGPDFYMLSPDVVIKTIHDWEDKVA